LDRYIFVINTGSTSTKLALYREEACVVREDIFHSPEEIGSFPDIFDQYDFRMNAVKGFLSRNSIEPSRLSAVAARGGHTVPVEGGIYRIEPLMLSQIRSGAYGRHPCDLSSAIAYELSYGKDILPVVVDPPITDELDDLARLSGHPLIRRRSRFHALNLKAVAGKTAEQLGRPMDDLNLIGIHMGGGISVCACRKGRIVDCNNALDGDGPFSPERSGALPVWDLVELCLSGEYSREEIRHMIVGGGGLMAYLGSKDVPFLEEQISHGNDQVRLVLEGMAYQVAKEAGAMAAVLEGEVDAVFLTGGIARSVMITDWIHKRIAFIAPLIVFPGEFEMEALALGAIRALDDKRIIKSI
jgi:butyrate kinase